ncbi:hypothetical protein DFH08DRAFT_794363 [Mycena albidolilacea]|uniref:Mediator of RNA polymerase II transcription subunit 21 n=1 Tax=Mycena albidolilacea TaxID=1033008 RepID=A0AAD6Z0E0_9AGAR|nr:hypothetical protein DFH08DRAFT_794363 [Mycena albidolilacea]
MLQRELSRMNRITQLQDETQQLLTIMASSIVYLTSRTDFVQVSADIPITKQRNPDKYDSTEIFQENNKELATDLIVKAKQVEYLVKSLPQTEPKEDQDERLLVLDAEMTVVNDEYIQAVARSKVLQVQITDVLKLLLQEPDPGLEEICR